MEKDKSRIIILCLITVILFCKGNLYGTEKELPVSNAKSPYFVSVKNLPAFLLPAIQNEPDKNYLGLSANGDFNIGQIKAEVLIIEFFSFYCPHCQRAAARVNEIYQHIQNQASIKEKIKIIGIGAGNSDYEVNSFREKYQVPFPLFADKDMEKFNLFRARSTPAFIGIKINKDGSLDQFYFREGGFSNSEQFLDEIIKLSGI